MNSRQTVIIRAYERVGANDRILLNKVLDRALALAASFGRPMNRLSLLTDLMIAHATVGIRLNELLAADDGNFAHDVFGVERHLNRDTGELGDGFMPRFATGITPGQDAEADRILAMTDDEIIAYATEQGLNPAEIFDRIKKMLAAKLDNGRRPSGSQAPTQPD